MVATDVDDAVAALKDMDGAEETTETDQLHRPQCRIALASSEHRDDAVGVTPAHVHCLAFIGKPDFSERRCKQAGAGMRT